MLCYCLGFLISILVYSLLRQGPCEESKLLLTLRTLNYFHHFLPVFPSLIVWIRGRLLVVRDWKIHWTSLLARTWILQCLYSWTEYPVRVCATPSVFSLLVIGAHHKNLGVQLKPNQTWQKIISRVQKEKRSPFLFVIRLICAWNVSLKKVVCFGKAGFLSRISVPIMRGYPLLLWQGLWSVNSVGEKGIGILITSTCGPSAQLYPCLGKRPTGKGFLNPTYVCIFYKGVKER